MKDLDFDELDKAVSSLMGGVPKVPDPSSEAEKTVTIPSSEQVSSAPMSSSTASVTPTVSRPQQIKPVQTSPASRPSAAPASRRAGRFMDVVRPPASPNKQEVPSKVSRQGIALEPVSTNVESTASAAELSTTPSIVGTDIQAKLDKTPQGDWPDPLDMAGFSKTSTTTEMEGNDKKLDTAKSEAIEPSPSDASLASPFLPDTKVEKRPLGANAVASAGITEPSEQPEEVQASDGQLPATLEDTKSILPEELHSHLVAIESDTTSPQEEEPVKQEAPEPWKSPESKVDAPPAESSKPSIPISIPQQYKEEASTGEKESGAIYDTDSYHKPLAHPTKQKSGWMWVLWIVLILIIGAGGGAALYFLRLV